MPSALTLSNVLVLGAWILFDEDEHTDVLRVLVGWIRSNGGINVLRGSVTSDDWEMFWKIITIDGKKMLK